MRRIETEGSMRLPESSASDDQAPWDLAQQVAQDLCGNSAVPDTLSGIYLQQGEAQMIFVYMMKIDEPLIDKSRPSTRSAGTFLSPEEAQNLIPAAHQTILSDAVKETASITCKILP